MSAIIMILPIAAMLFFMQRSQKKQQQERQNLMDSITVGSRVVTVGGLHGVVSEINKDKNTVVLDCEGIYLEFERASMRTVKPAAVVENDDSVTEVIVEEETPTE
ncbi:preprotein translocase subunit YajC [Enterococcus sp. LJL98]